MQYVTHYNESVEFKITGWPAKNPYLFSFDKFVDGADSNKRSDQVLVPGDKGDTGLMRPKDDAESL